jgi:opacity protein-like surface antigen
LRSRNVRQEAFKEELDRSSEEKMKITRPSLFVSALTAFFLVAVTSYQRPALAQEEANYDVWQVEMTPYLFAAGLKGTVGFKGVAADIDVGTDQLLDNLNKAFMLFATAERNNWIFALDTMYFNLEAEQARSWQGPLGSTSTADLKADVEEQFFALGAGRRVVDDRSKVDVLAVARYTSLETTLGLKLTTGPPLLPDGSRSISIKESWWDAAIALKGKLPIAQKWDLTGYADVGAGGSDLTYQIMLGVNWQFSKVFSAKLGYRYLYQDYRKNDLVWDMATSGATLGLGIRF